MKVDKKLLDTAVGRINELEAKVERYEAMLKEIANSRTDSYIRVKPAPEAAKDGEKEQIFSKRASLTRLKRMYETGQIGFCQALDMSFDNGMKWQAMAQDF